MGLRIGLKWAGLPALVMLCTWASSSAAQDVTFKDEYMNRMPPYNGQAVTWSLIQHA